MYKLEYEEHDNKLVFIATYPTENACLDKISDLQPQPIYYFNIAEINDNEWRVDYGSYSNFYWITKIGEQQ